MAAYGSKSSLSVAEMSGHINCHLQTNLNVIYIKQVSMQFATV